MKQTHKIPFVSKPQIPSINQIRKQTYYKNSEKSHQGKKWEILLPALPKSSNQERRSVTQRILTNTLPFWEANRRLGGLVTLKKLKRRPWGQKPVHNRRWGATWQATSTEQLVGWGRTGPWWGSGQTTSKYGALAYWMSSWRDLRNIRYKKDILTSPEVGPKTLLREVLSLYLKEKNISSLRQKDPQRNLKEQALLFPPVYCI